MITAIVLISVTRSKINEIAEELTEIEGISEVYSVSGDFDIVAMLRVKTNEDLADIVTKKITKIDGIIKTQTMLAFMAYSKHDLESMFGLD
jgi:DNA-binding Lrp family transcriptional regulator